MVLKFVILHFQYSNICKIVNKNYQFLRFRKCNSPFCIFWVRKNCVICE